ncbi:TonB-dependent receptor plug domain-containing protein [Chryseobacterium kwangjuense]|uniref:TonB-dependent receptor plug domain-containing protein n=1 Tax=Chryseobacterium kwangjuense TaxID=267125 RepID=A0A135WK91_9FLAO|nr:TonB-dependent receptor plug domain-containing protein [Chryseobacterium kwangjuense]KXH85311.1 hypothetical protein AU378_06050 [Chryseobacterium kwangjuense]
MVKKLLFILAVGMVSDLSSQLKAEAALETFKEKYQQEKVHLLFDKNSYLAGENLWFKSFVFDGYDPSMISTNLFVELYDQNKTQIAKTFVPLQNGRGSGSLAIPETLKENIYYIRAYTTWMTNFSEDFQLIRPVEIYNPSSPEKLVKDSLSAWSAVVYPESGTFIEGISTKFAVRLNSKGFTPSEWNGYVIDTEKPDIKITSFTGFDENVGAFELIPQNGKNYQLILSDTKGAKQNINLPKVASSGVHLKVKSGLESVTLTLNGKNLSASGYKIIGTMNSQMVYKAVVPKITGQVLSIPADKLVNGILYISVFDDQENIVAQRLCFVQHESLKIKKPDLKSLTLDENPRASNSFSIAKESESDYSVLIMDGAGKSSEDDNSLLSTLWLTGDVNSKINSPARYFKENSNGEALDALLISEKWKRFDWKMMMLGNYPVIKNKPEHYISYKGKVSVQEKPAPNTDLNLVFSNSGQPTGFHQVKTDDKGFFTLNGLIFEDALKVSYQLNTEQKIPKEQVQVIFQPDFDFVPYKGNMPESRYQLVKRTPNENLPDEVAKYVANKKIQKIFNDKTTNIEEVKLKGKKKNLTTQLNNQLSSSLFRSGNEVVFDFVNDNTNNVSTNILQWLQGRVAGLDIQSQAGNYVPMLRGSGVGIYLDEMPVSADYISTLPVADIAMVKVIKGYFAAGFGGGNGAIAIYTRRGGITGSVNNSARPSMLKQISLKGYQKEAPFISPDYSSEDFKNTPQDVRPVLYWNPYLEFRQEPAKVQFYNNDEAKNYRIIILGYDKNNYIPVYYNEVVK